MPEKERSEFVYEIKEEICALGERKSTGYRKELNVVSFNGNPAKLDIRGWNADHTSMTKGVSLTDEEMDALIDAASEYKKKSGKSGK